MFVLIGVSLRFTRSTKVYVDREGETSTLKRWNGGGGSDCQVIAASIKGCGKKAKTNLCDVECCRCRSRCFLSQDLGADWLFELSLTIL